MYLKRVVMNGFKSFADRTEFEFGPGITGIVGPNGCGKSNVVDAVRWVLGEQSAKSLRGGKMLDVVFSGARGRAPAEYAQVELTFDNASQFLSAQDPEVVVARTLFRSGDSEYRLNGNICRLKDIRELLLDTGVAVGAYSIIEQGRVDVLLQANPLQRREIFEEAAGISRYRIRRVEAQRKLERTQNNLLRLNDVIDELERQLRSVKLAAGKARNFQEYDQRLRELRSSFALAEYHEFEQQSAQAREQIEQAEQQLAEQRATLAHRDEEAAGVERELTALDQGLREAEAALAQVERERSTLEERQVQSERRLGELSETRSRREAQHQELVARSEQLERRVAEEEQTARTLVAETEQRQADIDRLRGERDSAGQKSARSRSSLEAAKDAAYEAVRQAMLVQNQQRHMTQEREKLGAQLQRHADREQEIVARQSQMQQQRDVLSQQAADANQKATELSGRVRAAESRTETLRGRRGELDGEVSERKERRAAVESRLSVLTDMERRRDGVDGGTQAVLDWRFDEGEESPVVGLVADVLRIDDPRVAALEPVLATFENHVVVRDTAALVAELQRRGRLPGPVRVIGLDRLPRRAPADTLSMVDGVVARAADWVRCAPEFAALAEHLLGQVYVVETWEVAQQLAGQLPDNYSFVTLDGYLLRPGGVLVAGTQEAAGGLISRKAEIRQLERELDEVETALERAVRQRQAVEAELQDVRVQRDGLLDELATAQKHYADQQTALMRLDDEAQRIDRELEACRGETAQLQRSDRELEAALGELEAQRQAAEADRSSQESTVSSLERELAELDAAVAQLSQQLTQAMVEIGRHNERRSAVDSSLASLREQHARLQQEQSAAAEEAGRAAESMAAVRDELEQTRAGAERLLKQRQAREAEIAQQRAGREALRGRLDRCTAAGRELHERLERLEHGLHERQMRLREAELRKENLVSRVRDELSLELVELYASYEHAEQDWAAVREEIDTLRQKIQRLGNVNLDALRELEELAPRFEHLQTQRQDLLDAVSRLEKLIEELDEKSEKLFAESFAEIRTHFAELFRKLFGGGKADILLEDEARPLECGIEIIARPPGKEPQSISLLSGGEKTMAAVALLLAVFKSRPSPFAILDEVDAALDEANVGRFNSVVQEFLEHSQFVVITHNKRTMQSCGMLYGVTMQETGVSKRVSVRFDDCVDTPNVA